MTDERRDEEIEARLACYRPAAPDDRFRERMLASPAAKILRPPIVELAAGLLLAALLYGMAAETTGRNAHLPGGITNGAEIEAELIQHGVPAAHAAWWLTPLTSPTDGPTDESES